jgi:fructose-bisphosphate aldolase class I
MKVSIASTIISFSVALLTRSDAFSLRSTGGTHLTKEQRISLEKIAASVATAGKGITACDEGPGTIGARFEAVGVENTEENRRRYRQMLFETPGCEDFLSAAILDPETLYQKSSTNGKFFPEVLSERGIVPGIKPHLKVSISKIAFNS